LRLFSIVSQTQVFLCVTNTMDISLIYNSKDFRTCSVATNSFY